MKKIYSAFLLLSLLFATSSCDKEMPYPIDQVKRGVAIDVSRVSGTDGVLSDGMTTGDYKLTLTIPEQQGDYSFMKHAQLLAVLQGGDGKMTSKIIVDNITEFPKEFTIDIADVYSKFGLTSPELGETLYFTANAVLTDGNVIPGWTELTGFNNRAFAGWKVGEKLFSYNVRYPVACFFDQDPDSGTFIGAFTCYESSQYGNDTYPVTLTYNPNKPPSSSIPVGVDPENLYGIDISPISPNIWVPAIDVITVWIFTEDHSLVIPTQDTGDLYSPGNPIVWYNFRDTSVSTCSRTIKFTTNPYIIGLGGYGAFTFTIAP